MVRITVDTNQDDPQTIRSVIALLERELETSPQQPQPISTSESESTKGGAFQQQDTSSMMSMFSQDMPSTGHQKTTSESTDFFGNVDAMTRDETRKQESQRSPSKEQSTSFTDLFDDVKEYH